MARRRLAIRVFWFARFNGNARCTRRDMQCLLDEIIVAARLPDNPVIAYRGLGELAVLERTFKAFLGNTSCLVLLGGSLVNPEMPCGWN